MPPIKIDVWGANERQMSDPKLLENIKSRFAWCVTKHSGPFCYKDKEITPHITIHAGRKENFLIVEVRVDRSIERNEFWRCVAASLANLSNDLFGELTSTPRVRYLDPPEQ